jgi:hypothetical protein
MDIDLFRRKAASRVARCLARMAHRSGIRQNSVPSEPEFWRIPLRK